MKITFSGSHFPYERTCFFFRRYLLLFTTFFLLSFQSHASSRADSEISIPATQELTIEEVFHMIEKQTEHTFVYQSDLFNDDIHILVPKGIITVEELLRLALANSNVKFSINAEGNILLHPFEEEAKIEAAQEVVSGTVTDENGGPLPGVNVFIKGTTTGVQTDFDGNYRIEASEGDILVFSYVGLSTFETTVGLSNTIDVILEPDENQLEEVVITALGISRSERSLGYATQEVDGEDLTVANEQNVLGSLSGKVAGVQVTGASGASMGGTQKIKIRGVNSISGEGEPLIVVDGSPISNANFAGSSGADYGNLGQDINPADIESINVLKGPAASALYGIRGQYGVIMITTKGGRKGAQDLNVTLNSSFSIERAGNFFPLQNLYGQGTSQTWRTLPNGERHVHLSTDESWGPRLDGTPARQFYSFYPQDPLYGEATPFVAQPDNIKDYYETGHTFNNGVSVSGGSENSRYRLSVNDTRIQGVEPNTWLKRNNFGLNAAFDLTDKLNLSTVVNYAGNNAERPVQGYGSKSMVQWLPRNVDMNRLENYQYDDGTFLNWNLRNPSGTTGEVSNFNGLYWINPYVEANENIDNDRRDRFFGNIGLSYQVMDGLKLSGFIRADMYTQNIENISVFRYGSTVPRYAIGKYQNKEMNYEFLAEYNKEWGDFSFNANVGGNIFDRRYSYLYQATAGGLSAPGFFNIDASIDRPSTSSYLLRKQIRSGFGMISLGYRDTYFLDGSIRNDNSSALPEENNSYWYPSISGSFVFSELLGDNFLSFGKLRLSYAQAGSDLDAYQTSFVYNVGSIYAGDNGTVNTLTIPNNLIDPNIKPSFAHSYEAGFDLRFFDNRLGLDFTLYRQRNENQILNLDISGMSGYGSTTINAGVIENEGFELQLTGTPIETENISWRSTLNLSKNESMVVELYPGSDVYAHASTTFSSVPSYLNSYVGREFGSLVGQAYQRDPSTGKVLLDANNLPLYTDASHNFGSVLPDFTGGFQNSVRIGNFDLSAMMDFQVGGQFFSRTKMIMVRTGVDPITAAINDQGMNVRDPLEEGGGVKVNGISAETGEEVTTYVDARRYYNGVIGRHVYEEWLYDASYLKLRELRVGYSFNRNNIENLPFEDITLALIARNPLMIWQEAPQGLDPSEISTGGSSISWFESGQTNTVRSFGVNLNITL